MTAAPLSPRAVEAHPSYGLPHVRQSRGVLKADVPQGTRGFESPRFRQPDHAPCREPTSSARAVERVVSAHRPGWRCRSDRLGHVLVHMAMAVCDHPIVAMTALRDAEEEQHRRGGVPSIVQPRVSDAGLAQKRLPAVVSRARVDRPPVVLREHPSRLPPRFWPPHPLRRPGQCGAGAPRTDQGGPETATAGATSSRRPRVRRPPALSGQSRARLHPHELIAGAERQQYASYDAHGALSGECSSGRGGARGGGALKAWLCLHRLVLLDLGLGRTDVERGVRFATLGLGVRVELVERYVLEHREA